jgi:hypothetical protein
MKQVTLAILSLALVLDCSSGGAISPPPPGPSAADACTIFAQAQCAKLQSCSNAVVPEGVSILRNYDSLDQGAYSCLTLVMSDCTNRLAAPGNGNNPTLTEQCAAAYATLSCQDFFDNVPAAGCAPAGPRANGQPCAVAGQCASAYCNGNKTAVCGTCTDPPLAGSSCAASVCAHGQDCNAYSQVCMDNIGDGVACDGANASLVNCASGLTCSGTVGSKTCVAGEATEGAACGATGPLCLRFQGLACEGPVGSKTCTKVVLVADAQPCGTLADGTRADCLAGECYTATGLAQVTELGTCKKQATNGGPCDTVLGPTCYTGARCVTAAGSSAGVCAVPDVTTCY